MTTRDKRLLAAAGLIGASILSATLANASDPRTSTHSGDKYGYTFNIDKPRDVLLAVAWIGICAASCAMAVVVALWVRL
ncbi:hypothetical protein AB4Z48_27385 [Cupriavidus sp. 2TAF22]|uniref:hypothetical protein n=1 Tax=unclassified Cupriavidus TaxID=2640874 RepID=UPI003F8FEF3B